MGQGKRAWIYCAIDAPEDRNGALKSQFKQLIDYGEQMGFELVGSSSDVGTTLTLESKWISSFYRSGSRKEIGRCSFDCKPWQAVQIIHAARYFSDPSGSYDVDAYSPLEGKIEFGS